MPDATITAANVAPATNSTTSLGTAGATATAGQSAYYNSTNGKWALAQADGTAEEAGASGLGIFLQGVSDGQPCTILKGTDGNPFDPGFTATEGVVYVVSATAGGIAPIGDLVTGDYVSIIGVGDSDGKIVPIMTATDAEVQ